MKNYKASVCITVEVEVEIEVKNSGEACAAAIRAAEQQVEGRRLAGWEVVGVAKYCGSLKEVLKG